MKYLFIGSHIDDVELCAGGFLIRQLSLGHECTVVSLSHKYNGISLMHEWSDSMNTIKPDSVWIKDFKTRRFHESRQNILDYLCTLKGYDFVVTHSAKDFHQDHAVVGDESLRAFKHCNLLTYQGEWNQRTFHKNYFVELFKNNVEKKIKALSCYKSQSEKPYMHPDYTWANALNNGVIAGCKYAEGFELINYLE